MVTVILIWTGIEGPTRLIEEIGKRWADVPLEQRRGRQ
jgi:hypothetical protein